MKYLGSKRRISKHILPIMEAYRKPGQTWVEPFVGGGNILDKVEGERVGVDINPYLIEALRLIRDNPESIPTLITEDDYKEAQANQEVNGLVGFIGFSMSFGAKWFAGYRRERKGERGDLRNMILQTTRARNEAIKQSPSLQGVEFICSGYDAFEVPAHSLIYCDPPYKGSTKYKGNVDFDHDKFFEWCRRMSKGGHTVFVSEYEAPSDFKCVWQQEIISGLTNGAGAKKAVERLFVYD